MGRMWIIGLMSGTSADGVDAALVEWPDDARTRPFRLIAYEETSFPGELQRRIHRLAAGEVPGAEALADLVALDVALGERFAEAAAGVASRAGIELERVNKYPFSPYDCFEGLVEREPGRFYREHRGHDAPLVYTVTGRRSTARR